MYTIRAILVCCSVFALVYVFASAGIAWLWKSIAGWLWVRSPRRLANSIYRVRMSPLVFAFIFVFLFTMPAFLRFEPRVSEESVGVLPAILTLAFLLIVVTGLRRAWGAYSQALGWIRRCTADSAPYGAETDVAVVRFPEAPPVALAGIRKSIVLISLAVRTSLTVAELRCTIAHELAHARARDNLKKLLIHACAFPGLVELERLWLESIEFAADAAAVKSDADAVELASALVKVSRLHRSASPAMVTGFAEGPSALLAARVERLLHRDETTEVDHETGEGLAAGIGAVALAIALNYEAFLRAAHRFTELLVR